MKLSAKIIGKYRAAIESAAFGKRVGTHFYVHRVGLDQLDETLGSIARLADKVAASQSFAYDVLKFGVRIPSLSLLAYPTFFEDPFPVLHGSGKLDLTSHGLSIIDFSTRANRPILHRKELMLPVDHPAVPEARELSRQAEALGLFDNSSAIGTEQGWLEALTKKGVVIEGARLTQPTTGSTSSRRAPEVHRHRTALSRDRLSVPFQQLEKFGYLNAATTVLDYGCGRGDDVRLLGDAGVPVLGWDPHYFPDGDRAPRDVVNLGYVLNVIEDLGERERTLRAAFSLAKRVLCVSVLMGSPEYEQRAEKFQDGLRTGLGTFQKYYLPDEFQNYVRSVLGVPCVAISQGTILAFATQEELERFRAKRAGLRGDQPRGSVLRASELYVFDEGARETLDEFWSRCVYLGREPLLSELDELSDVSKLSLSPKAAFQFLLDKLGSEQLRPAMFQRIEELLVEFALAHFEGRIFFKYLDESVKRDIESFFENYSDLRAQARALLFAIADTQAILQACNEAAAEGNGYLFTDHSLQLHVSLIERLPPLLRVFEGTARRLLGGRGRANLVKLHVTSGKVTYLTYDDFEGLPVPNLVERIKVDLPKRKIDYFDYIGPFEPNPLVMKSLFMDEENPNYHKQSEFDRQMLKAGVIDPVMPHPSAGDLREAMRSRELEICDWTLRRTALHN